MWTCISVYPKFMPGEEGFHDVVFSYPRVIEPDETDGYNVYLFTDEWLWDRIRHSFFVKLKSVEETPFDGPLFEGWIQEEE